jgi:apolipoprotein N-acyltransferase
MALSVPNFNLWPLAWIGLVPVLVALELRGSYSTFHLLLPGTAIWCFAAHLWYPDVLGPVLGWVLIGGSACFYAGLLELGFGLGRRGSRIASLLVLPATWTALEWLRAVLPVTRDWWFVPLAQSQRTFPSGLSRTAWHLSPRPLQGSQPFVMPMAVYR